ncbi:MAG: type IV secretion system protein VirB10 [Inquilinus sp.]|uniref:type IV secretion system protein VirB10 n=1 Tax=Inquilinus sp. TaxID=1932117 RepID=UPI003F2A4E45
MSGERHVSAVAGRQPFLSKKLGIGVMVTGAAILCGLILVTGNRPDLPPDDDSRLTIGSQVAYVPPPLPTTPASYTAPVTQTATPPLPEQPVLGLPASGAATPPRQRRLLVYSAGGGNADSRTPGSGLMSPDPDGTAGARQTAADLAGGADGPGADIMADRRGNADSLASRLTPTPLAAVSASVLRHQPFLLTTGTMMPCILQTAMDSTLPGLVTCVIPQDILGKTGLTLLDRGTRVVGEFKGGVRQGVERMFVVWTRAETPQGVVISLDSPATDPLGRSGMDGEVDGHFWQRFGGALLLSTVDGAIQAGIAEASKSGTTTINTGSTESVIAESLRGSINIPPTIRKNQGELVSILVARDLDFSTVYGVRPTPPRAIGPNRSW